MDFGVEYLSIAT